MWKQLLVGPLQARSLIRHTAPSTWWVAATCVGAVRRIGTGFRQTTGTQSGISSVRGLPPWFGKGKPGSSTCSSCTSASQCTFRVMGLWSGDENITSNTSCDVDYKFYASLARPLTLSPVVNCCHCLSTSSIMQSFYA